MDLLLPEYRVFKERQAVALHISVMAIFRRTCPKYAAALGWVTSRSYVAAKSVANELFDESAELINGRIFPVLDT